MEPRTLSAAPAAAAKLLLGCTPDRDQHQVGAAGEVGVSEDAQAIPVGRDPAHRGAGVDVDLMLGQLVANERAELRVDGWEHLGEPLYEGHRESSVREGFGHFEADVAGADDQNRPGLALAQGAIELERLIHVVQQTNAWQVGAGQAGQHRTRSGRHDEPVVGERFGRGVWRLDRDALGYRVDRDSGRVEPES